MAMANTRTPDKAARLDQMITYLEILVAVVTIVGTIWTIASASSESVVVIVNPAPSAAADPAPSAAETPELAAEYPAPDSDRFRDDDERFSYSAYLLEQGQYLAAENFLTDFLNLIESNSEDSSQGNSQTAAAIQYNRGLARLYGGKYSPAIDDFTDVTRFVNYAPAYYNLGNAHAKLGEDDDAFTAYEKAASLSEKPEYAEARDFIQTRLDAKSAMST